MPELDAVKLLLDGPMEALTEAVGLRGSDLRSLVADLVNRQIDLEGMTSFESTVLAAIVGEQPLDPHLLIVIEGDDSIIQCVCRSDRHLAEIDLGEGLRAVCVNDRLHVDLADAFDRAYKVSVLAKQIARMRCSDMLFRVNVSALMLLQEPLGLLRQHAAFGGGLLVQPEQALEPESDAVPYPDPSDGGGRDTDADQTKLVGNADVTVGWILRRHLEDLFFELRRSLVRHPGSSALLGLETLGAVLLVGFLDLVEVAPTDAGSLASGLDIAQFLGELEQSNARFDKLLVVAHECVLSG